MSPNIIYSKMCLQKIYGNLNLIPCWVCILCFNMPKLDFIAWCSWQFTTRAKTCPNHCIHKVFRNFHRWPSLVLLVYHKILLLCLFGRILFQFFHGIKWFHCLYNSLTFLVLRHLLFTSIKLHTMTYSAKIIDKDKRRITKTHPNTKNLKVAPWKETRTSSVSCA